MNTLIKVLLLLVFWPFMLGWWIFKIYLGAEKEAAKKSRADQVTEALGVIGFLRSTPLVDAINLPGLMRRLSESFEQNELELISEQSDFKSQQLMAEDSRTESQAQEQFRIRHLSKALRALPDLSDFVEFAPGIKRKAFDQLEESSK